MWVFHFSYKTTRPDNDKQTVTGKGETAFLEDSVSGFISEATAREMARIYIDMLNKNTSGWTYVGEHLQEINRIWETSDPDRLAP